MQEISDSVADVEWEEETVGNAIAACAAQTAELAAKINTDRARHRYLENLVDKDNAADDDDEDQATCILCRCDFSRGFITHWYVLSDCRFVQKFIYFFVVRISSARYVSSLHSNELTWTFEIGLHESLAASEGGQILSCLQV